MDNNIAMAVVLFMILAFLWLASTPPYQIKLTFISMNLKVTTYGLPPRPDLLRIALDTHNYYFPEERRRMYKLTNLLFEHFQLLQYSNLNQPDFRQNWDVSYYGEEI